MFVPNAPMQFASLNIGYLPTGNSGYQYILLIGDVFSKFIQAVPSKDQIALTIVDAFVKSWLYIHGMPYYLLTDQSSNVYGEVMKEICFFLFNIKTYKTRYLRLLDYKLLNYITRTITREARNHDYPKGHLGRNPITFDQIPMIFGYLLMLDMLDLEKS